MDYFCHSIRANIVLYIRANGRDVQPFSFSGIVSYQIFCNLSFLLKPAESLRPWRLHAVHGNQSASREWW